MRFGRLLKERHRRFLTHHNVTERGDNRTRIELEFTGIMIWGIYGRRLRRWCRAFSLLRGRRGCR